MPGARSARASSTGYRKGITAIIDANVVTIMTAFILFVLATSDVKGFAFTLGIGTFVSLFTAVLATQAILMTMGDSRVIQSPSALGAGGRSAALALRLHGREPVLLLDVGRDPARRRAGDRRARPEPRHRLHRRHADLGRARSTRRPSPRSSRWSPASAARTPPCRRSRQQDARQLRLPDRFEVPGAGHYEQPAHRAAEQVRDPRRHQGLQHARRSGPSFGSTITHSARGRDHRLADRDLALRRAAVRVEVHGPGADRADARPADHRRRVRAHRSRRSPPTPSPRC